MADWLIDIQGYTTILDADGEPVERRRTVQFVGATVQDTGTITRVEVAPGATGPDVVTIQSEGVTLGTAHTLNFVGLQVSLLAGVATISALPVLLVETLTGTGPTFNARVLPTALVHMGSLAWISNGTNITLNGIDLSRSGLPDIPDGFRFVLRWSDANGSGATLTINDESGSATADERISTPNNAAYVLTDGDAIWIERSDTRWGIIDRIV